MDAGGEIPGYDLEAVVGRGAMGTVWRARQRSSGGRVVALKRVPGGDRHLAERLRREGAVLGRLDHPHIVRLFELLPDGAGVAIAMQYAPGGSLADLLARRGRLEPDEAVAVLAPIADALGSAHRHGVVHRDVKPSNILFTSDGEPLLSDFGIARTAGDQPLTDPALSAMGTAEYLDPEVAAGAEPDARSDVYALGAVCYETLAGRRPFEAATPLAVLRLADAGQAPSLTEPAPHVPPALVAAVARALSRQPDQRFADAGQLAIALRHSLDPARVLVRRSASGPGTDARPAPETGTRSFGPRPPRGSPAVPAAPPRVSRGRWALLAVGAALLAGVAAAAVLVPRERSADPPPTADAPAALPYCQSPPPPAGADEIILEGDLTGAGCRSWVRRQGAVLEAALLPGEPARYEVGRPTDVLLLGDWNCDGRDTAGLYRPDTGEVFLFEDWPDDEPLSSRSAVSSGVLNGRARSVTADGCDEVVVDQAAT